ncbi:MAG: DUF488 domain-containing protein [Acidobacteriota bacterium]|nr:DUF488 domain-containing protein [Acidobacteriota bacterium]
MELTLCTIGFAGKTAEQFFALLTEAGVRRVLDIRGNRGGQLSAFAKHPDLAFFLQRLAGIEYAHEPRFAPSPEIRKAYRASKDWPQYEAAFLALMRERDFPGAVEVPIEGGPLALLCSEPGPEKCHRRLVAELLAENLRGKGHTVHVRHLTVEQPTPKPKSRKRAA